MFLLSMALMGLGLLPLWTQCQLFSSASMSYPNYALPYYGGIPSPAAYIADNGGLGYGALMRNYMYPPNQAPLDIQFMDSDPSLVLPNLPSKLDSAGQKRRAPYGFRALYDASDMSYDPVNTPNFTKDRPKLYKGVYPSKFIDGQPYGSYTAFLKTLLSGRQPEASSAASGATLTPSYSQPVPSVLKSALGNDYSVLDQPVKQERADYPFYSRYNDRDPDPKIIVTPVMYDPEKHPFSKDMPPYNSNQAASRSGEPSQEGLNFYPDERKFFGPPEPRSRFRPEFSARSFNPMRDIGKTGNYFWGQYGPDLRSMYEPMMQTYQTDRIPAYGVPYAMESRTYGQFNPYDHPNYISIVSKPGSAYSTSFAAPPGPSSYEVLNYDPEKPEYNVGQFQSPSKSRNIATYMSGNRDRQDYVSYSPKISSNSEPQLDNFTPPIRYPRLGSAIDSDYKLQQVPSVIAALFGGKRLVHNKPNEHGQGYSQDNQDYYRAARRYGSENLQQSPKFSTPTNPSYRNLQKEERQDAKATTPTDIFLPIARAVKQLDPIKTIVFPLSSTSQVS